MPGKARGSLLAFSQQVVTELETLPFRFSPTTSQIPQHLSLGGQSPLYLLRPTPHPLQDKHPSRTDCPAPDILAKAKGLYAVPSWILQRCLGRAQTSLSSTQWPGFLSKGLGRGSEVREDVLGSSPEAQSSSEITEC